MRGWVRVRFLIGCRGLSFGVSLALSGFSLLSSFVLSTIYVLLRFELAFYCRF